jgi:hypothetical protein
MKCISHLHDLGVISLQHAFASASSSASCHLLLPPSYRTHPTSFTVSANCLLLAVFYPFEGLGNGLKGHIVAEIRDVDNAPLIKMVGSPFIETVVSHDITGRFVPYVHLLLLQMCKQTIIVAPS